jgi:ABC-type phosphate transport system auxiliary subunit
MDRIIREKNMLKNELIRLKTLRMQSYKLLRKELDLLKQDYESSKLQDKKLKLIKDYNDSIKIIDDKIMDYSKVSERKEEKK